MTIFPWFKIFFVENDGMAWGAKLPGSWGKAFLSCFRILAIVFLTIWLKKNFQKNKNKQVLGISLILAGAIGNTIDSLFYGLIFTDSSTGIAEISFSENYGLFLFGKVVDMLHFPIFRGHFFDWIPFWGGYEFLFFSPVFNIADSAVTIGACFLVFFNKNF